MPVTFTINKSTAKDILSNLEMCNDSFIPPLNKKVNLKEYSEKMSEKSVRFEAWESNELIGLVSAYLNDAEKKSGFITNVSIFPTYNGKGIASELMKMCIEFSRKNNFKEINLEVSQKSNGAVHLYKKFGFVVIKDSDEMLNMKLDLTGPLQL